MHCLMMNTRCLGRHVFFVGLVHVHSCIIIKSCTSRMQVLQRTFKGPRPKVQPEVLDRSHGAAHVHRGSVHVERVSEQLAEGVHGRATGVVELGLLLFRKCRAPPFPSRFILLRLFRLQLEPFRLINGTCRHAGSTGSSSVLRLGGRGMHRLQSSCYNDCTNKKRISFSVLFLTGI